MAIQRNPQPEMKYSDVGDREPKPHAVPYALERLHELVGVLSTSMDDLRVRLYPVMDLRDGQSEDDESESAHGACEISERIDAEAERVDDMIQRVNGIISRLEI